MNADTPLTSNHLFKLLAHDLRWQIIRRLALSDCRVSDLTIELQQSANLISYHVGLLRAAGLLNERRSDADGRDSYYQLDLDCLGTNYRAVGLGLHPALLGAPAEALAVATEPCRPRVLFLCTHNSARSQMAEAIMRARSHGAIEVRSAGSEPTAIHPAAVRVLERVGIDVGDQRTKDIAEFVGQHFDYAITVCDRVREVCPAFTAAAVQAHWSIADPAATTGSPLEQDQAFEQTLRQLDVRIGHLLLLLKGSKE
ncbi:MAG TPA: protein tyrosine phosphatase [Kouleothrix sp.]|uniref:arsenate reductase/protein-tyrosine-phosphatase family protein n=1 Tax=Kouleothrix sp. TaxID=2779161 RepID=UPI002BFC5E2D|nr:protein tyrosine phosphatase [Kouleothrix sp.]HRC75145.1 protein tyrosine phosphatase [Kouleothrix sp.]